MKQYDIYLFDFDGTLFDTKDSMVEIFGAGFKAIGLPCSASQAHHYMHLSLEEVIRERNIEGEDNIWTFVRAVLGALDVPEFLALTHPFEDSKETLMRLKAQGKRLGIVSSNAKEHVELVLNQWGFAGFFDTIVGSKEGEPTKPNPKPIFDALSELGESVSDRVVYVGDSPRDALTAHNAKVDAILLERNHEYPDSPEMKITTLLELV